MRAVIFGGGATGKRVAHVLLSTNFFDRIKMCETSSTRRRELLHMFKPYVYKSDFVVDSNCDIPDGTDVVVVATPVGTQMGIARAAVQTGANVVTTTSEIIETRNLLASDQEVQYKKVSLIVGAGFMPGLTCLLARMCASDFDVVDEIHVAKAGTGGPACAQQHHRALSSSTIDWRDGRWTRRMGGSGRELCWFPEPVAGLDCYRGAMPDALLLVPEFPGVARVTARVAATRRDRFTTWLPMMRRPHVEGLVGAVRVEVRGRRDGQRLVAVLGVSHPPAVGAGIVAACTAMHILKYQISPGAQGLAGIEGGLKLLHAIAQQGLRPERFEGASTFA